MASKESKITKDLNDAAAIVRESQAVIISAGAGMGVDSGLPDFRGTEGFWRAYPAIAKLGLRFEDMANPGWFKESPELAWAFYGHRLHLYRETKPHEGFSKLLDMGKSKPLGYFVFTSNIDGHFHKAGFDPDRIVECHGSIHHFQCTDCCTEDIWDAAHEMVHINDDLFHGMPPLPACPRCLAMARPNVCMFDDDSWIARRSQMQEERLNHWLCNIKQARAKVALIEIGAGTAVPTVRHWSEKVAQELPAQLLRINPRESSVPPSGIGLSLNAAQCIQVLCGDRTVHNQGILCSTQDEEA